MKTNYTAGHDAEKRAANYLARNGYKIIELNWKTRYCEIDIVAQKDDIIFFVEVKYRKNGAYGTAMDYVTAKKLKQMAFAADMWVQSKAWEYDYQLAVVAVDDTQISLLNDL